MAKAGKGKGPGRGRGGFKRGRGGDRGAKSRGAKRKGQSRDPAAAVVNTPQRSRRDASQDKKPPLYFPGFRGPSECFVEESHPQFREILRQCYDGFCVEGADTFDPKVHDDARTAFDALEAGGIFRADVTQPFGLGTKCAATYVTRTLVGDPGTTYKYLGLRMFSHPWTEEAAKSGGGKRQDTDKDKSDRSEVSPALRSIGLLNEHLKERSKRLLEAKRNQQQTDVSLEETGADTMKEKKNREPEEAAMDGNVELGSCEFNVALINRMEPSDARPDLKAEPTFGQDRCSVSWHADSCLEHYSTVGVYHLTDPEASSADWRIALRVEHDAEGPSAGKLKHAGKKVGVQAPPVAVALPSRSAYFLLDDFNHHHQHAVLVGQSHRWSSTHRVAKKEGHSLNFIKNRCQAVLRDGHRRTLKQWKAEQQTLSELEFEWIRQFYVQGRAHYDLHSWWHTPMKELMRLWSLLEDRTGVVVNTLEGASEACFDRHQNEDKKNEQKRDTEDGGSGTASGGGAEQRREKKARQKRAKQKQAVETLGGRAAYTAIAEAVHDRAEKRRLWWDREADKVFKRLDEDARPLPCPLFSSSLAPSSLPATPDSLHALADAVSEWGKIYSGENGKRGGGLPQTAAKTNCPNGGVGGDGSSGLDGEVRSLCDQTKESEDRRRSSANGVSSSERPTAVEEGGINTSAIASRRVEDRNTDGDETGDRTDAWTDEVKAVSDRDSGTTAGKNNGSHSCTLSHQSLSTGWETFWKEGQYALEMQTPWAKRLLDGQKTVETRAYPLPAGLVGRSVELIESQAGLDGVSELGDVVEAGTRGLAAIGRVVFRATEAYASREAWVADQDKHLVSPDSVGYGWKGPGTIHGWAVGEVESYRTGDGDASERKPVRRMVRRFRSLFEIKDKHIDTIKDKPAAKKSKKKRSRKRKLDPSSPTTEHPKATSDQADCPRNSSSGNSVDGKADTGASHSDVVLPSLPTSPDANRSEEGEAMREAVHVGHSDVNTGGQNSRSDSGEQPQNDLKRKRKKNKQRGTGGLAGDNPSHQRTRRGDGGDDDAEIATGDGHLEKKDKRVVGEKKIVVKGGSGAWKPAGAKARGSEVLRPKHHKKRF